MTGKLVKNLTEINDGIRLLIWVMLFSNHY